MALDNITYLLEDIFHQVIGGDVVGIYTDLFGYECEVFEAVLDEYGAGYGMDEGMSQNYTSLGLRQILLGHDDYTWVKPGNNIDLGVYSVLRAYVRYEPEFQLPINGKIEVHRQDGKFFQFRVEEKEIIGSTTDIITRYKLVFMKK